MRIIDTLIASPVATNTQAAMWTATYLLPNGRIGLVTIKQGEQRCGRLVP
jgi:hypothetical protein